MPPPESFAPLPNEYVNFDLISQGELVMRIRNIPKVSFANIELFPNCSLILFICSYIERCSYSVRRTLRGCLRNHSPSTILASRNWRLVSYQNPFFSALRILAFKNVVL
jgi:hypothetical protein